MVVERPLNQSQIVVVTTVFYCVLCNCLRILFFTSFRYLFCVRFTYLFSFLCVSIVLSVRFYNK